MSQTPENSKFAICIVNAGYEDLQIWKLYQIIDDPLAASEDYLRVVDESGEDYLYPASRFVVVKFPKLIEERLLAFSNAS